jgi:ABC-type multidrug transport system permease subunit
MDSRGPTTQRQRAGLIRRDHEIVEFVWIVLGILYVACWIYFGLATFRKGHYWMFWIGFIFPILWIVGSLIGPTQRVVARAAASGV